MKRVGRAAFIGSALLAVAFALQFGAHHRDDVGHGLHDGRANQNEELNTSIMLMGSCTFIMALFYFVNHPNDDMKSHSWEVISSTICVFIAISIYSLTKIVAVYLLEVKSNLDSVVGDMAGKLVSPSFLDVSAQTRKGEDKDFVKVLTFLVSVQMTSFVVTQLVLGYQCGALTFWGKDILASLRPRNTETMFENDAQFRIRLDFWCQLLGNILMFSAANLFSTIQTETTFFKGSVLRSLGAVPLLVVYIAVLLLVMKGLHRFRMRGLGAGVGQRRQRKAEELWDSRSTDAICEMGGVAIAFLISQSVQYKVVGVIPMPNGWVDVDTLPPSIDTTKEYFQPSESMKNQMLVLTLCLFFAASVIARVLFDFKAIYYSKLESTSDEGPTAFESIGLPILEMMVTIVCTAFGWVLLTLTRWYCSAISLSDIILYKVFVALSIALVAFSVITLLNTVYTALEKRKQSALDEAAGASPSINAKARVSAPSTTGAQNDMLARFRSSVGQNIGEKASSLQGQLGLDPEESLAQMITALGVISGAGWEEAFGSANGILAEEMDLFPSNPAKGKILTHASICLMVIIVMLPAWKWYIIPTVHALKN